MMHGIFVGHHERAGAALSLATEVCLEAHACRESLLLCASGSEVPTMGRLGSRRYASRAQEATTKTAGNSERPSGIGPEGAQKRGQAEVAKAEELPFWGESHDKEASYQSRKRRKIAIEAYQRGTLLPEEIDDSLDGDTKQHEETNAATMGKEQMAQDSERLAMKKTKDPSSLNGMPREKHLRGPAVR
eukprot:4951047-Amphidinium_carterae.4